MASLGLAPSPAHDRVPLTPSIRSVSELLTDPALAIPSYQRPYRWGEDNALQLIADIQRFQASGHYRLGTVILHSGADHSGGGEAERLDIVDGQQRYLTFALIAHALAQNASLSAGLRSRLSAVVTHIRLPARRDEQTNENVRRNFEHVRTMVSRWATPTVDDFARFFLDECSVVVLEVADLDAAFQMFDSQNTRGRALYPTDLLKAYHLREFDRTDPGIARMREVVEQWESVPPAEVNHVISAVLFPIKRWAAHRPLPRTGFSADHIRLFKGVREGKAGNSHFRWARLALLALAATRSGLDNRGSLPHDVVDTPPYPFQLTQPVVDGEMFFAMVQHYVTDARRAGVRVQGLSDQEETLRSDLREPALASLLSILDSQPPGAGNRYVRELFDCLLLAYVDRFGWHHIDTAAVALAQYAYRLRVSMTRIAMPSVNTHALETHRRTSDRSENLFSTLARALDPDVVLTRSTPPLDRDGWNDAERRGLSDLFRPHHASIPQEMAR